MKRTESYSNTYKREYREVLPPNTRVAVIADFKNQKGHFNCRYRKYYYWCRGNQRWMRWCTFPYDSKDDMKDQVDILKTQIANKELLVDA